MTKLILVHGINNEKNSEARIRDEWIDTIRMTGGKTAAWAEELKSKTIVPFYGELLDDLADGRQRATAMGAGAEMPRFSQLVDAALSDLETGKQTSEIAVDWDDDSGAVAEAMGAGIHKRWVKFGAKVIQGLSPFQGRVALRFLKQAHAYIEKDNIAHDVNAHVRPFLEDVGKCVIVSHSLGTIVVYQILRELAREHNPVDSPLLVTLGSPLTIKPVLRKLAKPRNRPADIMRWVNGTDPEDFVALDNKITKDNFGPAVDLNISDIDNGHEDPHSITDYLSDKRIVDEILAAL